MLCQPAFAPMPLYWLVYRHNNQISVVIEPGASLIHARMRAALADLDQGEFTEGHDLDRKWKVAKEMIGRRLSQEEAKRLLAKLDEAKPNRTAAVGLAGRVTAMGVRGPWPGVPTALHLRVRHRGRRCLKGGVKVCQRFSFAAWS